MTKEIKKRAKVIDNDYSNNENSKPKNTRTLKTTSVGDKHKKK